MKQSLSQYTEEDLLAELARRKNQDNWYFMFGSDDNKAKPDFWITHKRYYHLHHAIDDDHIGHLVSVPEGFDEVMESTFEYEGTTENGERLLSAYGFTKLENPFMWGDALIVYVPFKIGGWPSLSMTCDTPEIKAQAQDWVRDSLPAKSDDLPSDWNELNYMAKIDEFARNNGLVTIVTLDSGVRNGIWQGAHISLLSKQVAESLPEHYRE